MEYTKNGYTGRVRGELTIVHSPDGHIVYCRKIISTEEELRQLVHEFSEGK